MSLLRLTDLHAMLGGRKALDGATLSVEPGELVALIGPNGAGKSTLMRAAIGLIPAEGARLLGGDRLEALDALSRARRAAYLPQDREIGWPIAVETLVGLGRAALRGPARESEADRAAVAAAMERMDVARFRDRAADALSGGERARALIARALAQEAPLLLADEPTAGLDPAHQIALMERFREMARAGDGVLISSHDLGLAARWADRVALLDKGRIVADGPPRAVLTAERLRAVYGVEAHIAEAAGGLLVTPLSLSR